MTTNIKEQLEAIPGAALVEFYDATHQKPWPVCAYKREDCNAFREFSHGTLVAKPADGWPDIWLWGRIQYRVVVKDAARQMLECMEVHMPRPAETYTSEPEPIEIPAFLKEPEPPQETIPEAIADLVRENEPYGEAKARLMALYISLQNKLMLGLASEAEGRTHTRLHGHLAWMAKGAADVTI